MKRVMLDYIKKYGFELTNKDKEVRMEKVLRFEFATLVKNEAKNMKETK